MLSKLELEVVNKHKEWGFGAYLQWVWMEYPPLQREIQRGEYPEQDRLKHLVDRMGQQKTGFDFCYLHSLPHEEVNPLKVEQEAWKLLSPKVKQHLDKFGTYIEGYSPQNVEQGQLLTHVDCGWNLLQHWNTISKSYKAKYEQVGDKVAEREEATRQLIQELSSREP
jgi:hypothetical protein